MNKFNRDDLVVYKQGIFRVKSIKDADSYPIYELELLSYKADFYGHVDKKFPTFLTVEEINIEKFDYKAPQFRIGEEVKYQVTRQKIIHSWLYQYKYYYCGMGENWSHANVEESLLRRA